MKFTCAYCLVEFDAGPRDRSAANALLCVSLPPQSSTTHALVAMILVSLCPIAAAARRSGVLLFFAPPHVPA